MEKEDFVDLTIVEHCERLQERRVHYLLVPKMNVNVSDHIDHNSKKEPTWRIPVNFLQKSDKIGVRTGRQYDWNWSIYVSQTKQIVSIDFLEFN